MSIQKPTVLDVVKKDLRYILIDKLSSILSDGKMNK